MACTGAIFKIRSETCQTEVQFCQNLYTLYMIEKESLSDIPKFCWSGSAVRQLFWRLLVIPYIHIGTGMRFLCLASAFRRRRHYVFGLSVRPSVRSLKYLLLTCTWVRWSTRPTVTVLRHVRPSVRRGFRAFALERMEGMAWNFTCWCILTIFRTD